MDVGFTTSAFGASSATLPSDVQHRPVQMTTAAPGVGTVLPQTWAMSSWPAHSGVLTVSHTAPRFISGNAFALPRIPLYEAARTGNTMAIRHMLAAGSGDFGVIDPATGYSALMLAAQQGHADIVSILCEHAAAFDLHRQDARGNTALLLAAAGGHAAVAMSLIDAGANTAHRNRAGDTAADLFMARGSLLSLASQDEMIASAADAVSLATQRKPSDVIAAAVTTTVSMDAPIVDVSGTMHSTDDARKQTAQKGRPEPASRTALKDAAERAASQDRAQRGMKVGLTAKSCGTALPVRGALSPQPVAIRLPKSVTPAVLSTSTPSCTIFEAVERHDAPALKRLLAEMRTSGKSRRTALRRLGAPQAPKSLPLKEATLTPLMLAAALGQVDMLYLLIDAGARINGRDLQGRTALMWAVAAGQPTLVQALLKAGARIDCADAEGKTALTLAADLGRSLIALVLLQNEANPNRADAEGKSILMYGAQHGHATIVQSLLHYGAEVNQIDSSGSSALIHAARNDHAAVVQIMLDHGASIDHANNSGVTALIKAVQKGHASTVRTLLLNGADVSPETRGSGATAMRIAMRPGNDECKRLLLSMNTAARSPGTHS